MCSCNYIHFYCCVGCHCKEEYKIYFSELIQVWGFLIHLGVSILDKLQVCMCKDFPRREGTSILPDEAKLWSKVVVLINTPTSNACGGHCYSTSLPMLGLIRLLLEFSSFWWEKNGISLWLYFECPWLWVRLSASLWDTFFILLLLFFCIPDYHKLLAPSHLNFLHSHARAKE